MMTENHCCPASMDPPALFRATRDGGVPAPDPAVMGRAVLTRLGRGYHRRRPGALDDWLRGLPPGLLLRLGGGSSNPGNIAGLPALTPLPPSPLPPSPLPPSTRAHPQRRHHRRPPRPIEVLRREDSRPAGSTSTPIPGEVRRAVPDKTDKNHGKFVGRELLGRDFSLTGVGGC